MAENLETEVENEIPSLTECLTVIGWGHRVKVACSTCGQKLDMTEIAPFAAVCCPNCSARVVRPVYFGNYILEDLGRKRDSLTTVFRAFDGKLGRYVSLKILNPEYAVSERTRSRFIKIANRNPVLWKRSASPQSSACKTFWFVRFPRGGWDS